MVGAIEHNYNTSAFKGTAFFLYWHTIHIITYFWHLCQGQNTQYTGYFSLSNSKLYSVFWSVSGTKVNISNGTNNAVWISHSVFFWSQCLRECVDLVLHIVQVCMSFICILQQKLQTLIKINTNKTCCNILAAVQQAVMISFNSLTILQVVKRHTF